MAKGSSVGGQQVTQEIERRLLNARVQSKITSHMLDLTAWESAHNNGLGKAVKALNAALSNIAVRVCAPVRPWEMMKGRSDNTMSVMRFTSVMTSRFDRKLKSHRHSCRRELVYLLSATWSTPVRSFISGRCVKGRPKKLVRAAIGRIRRQIWVRWTIGEVISMI